MSNEKIIYPVDLHIHLEIDPLELLEEAYKRGVKVIGVLKHDTIKGLPDLIKEAEKFNQPDEKVRVVPCIELSTHFMDNKELNIGIKKPKRLQLIGYDIEFQTSDFDRDLISFEKSRENRNRLMAEKFNKLNLEGEINIDVDPRDPSERKDLALILMRKYGKNKDIKIGKIIDNICEEIVKKKGAAEHKDVMFGILDYFFNEERSKPENNCYVGYEVFPESRDAVDFILKYKGIPIWSSPLQDFTEDEVKKLIPYLKNAGLMGLEARHPSQDDEQYEILSVLAQKTKISLNRIYKKYFNAKGNFFLTGGSDYRSPEVSKHLIGDYGIYEEELKRLDVVKNK